MKKIIFLFLTFATFNLKAQNYTPIINYAFNGTPTNGIKINTNIPFQNFYGMPTLIIEGYDYGGNSPIGLILNWYVYNGIFFRHSVSSFGNYTPEIKLYNENGKIVIFINDKRYFNRFTIRGFAKGLYEKDTDFEGWTIVDELPTGTHETVMTYRNKFAGHVTFTGNTTMPNGIWNSDGNVGIGTTSIPTDYKLAIVGKTLTEEVKVQLKNNWPDYVFTKEYKLPTLQEVAQHINEKGHLQNIPSAKEVTKDGGIELGEMNRKLLEKIEELTLYTIQQQKELEAAKEKNNTLERRLNEIEKLIKSKLVE